MHGSRLVARGKFARPGLAVSIWKSWTFGFLTGRGKSWGLKWAWEKEGCGSTTFWSEVYGKISVQCQPIFWGTRGRWESSGSWWHFPLGQEGGAGGEGYGIRETHLSWDRTHCVPSALQQKEVKENRSGVCPPVPRWPWLHSTTIPVLIDSHPHTSPALPISAPYLGALVGTGMQLLLKHLLDGLQRWESPRGLTGNTDTAQV